MIAVKGKASYFMKQNKADAIDQTDEQELKVQQTHDHIEEYGEQYNANHDFAIFQSNNARVGGLMSLVQKQNLADSVADKSFASSYNTERN